MAVIQKTLDPRTNEEIVFAKGKIKNIRLQKFDEPQVKNFNGKAFTSTHKASLLLEDLDGVDGDRWINLGNVDLKQNTTLNVKVADKKWNALAIGMVISADVQVNGEYYNSSASKIRILDASNATTTEKTSNTNNTKNQSITSNANNGKTGSKVYGVIESLDLPFAGVKDDKGTISRVNVSTAADCEQLEVGMRLTAVIDKFGNILSGYKSYQNQSTSKRTNKRDNSGVEVGHATNVTFKLMNLTPEDISDEKNHTKIKNHIKKVLVESHKFREDQRTNYSDLDDYTFGAKAGQSILLAADLANDLPKTLKLAAVLMPLIHEVETGWKTYLDKQKQEEQQVVETASNNSKTSSNKTDQPLKETVGVEDPDIDSPPPFGEDNDPDWDDIEEANQPLKDMPQMDFDDEDLPF